MTRRPVWTVIHSLAVLATLLSVSCSRPGQDLQSAKASPPAARTSERDTPQVQPVEQPRAPIASTRSDEVQKTRREPARSTATPVHAPPPPSAAVTSPPRVEASAPAPAAQTASSTPQPSPIVVPAPQAEPIAPPAPPPPEPTSKRITIPAGTDVYVRMIDSIDSERSHPNETFRASLDKPVTVGKDTVIPSRSNVFVKLVEVQSAGKLSGTSELKVELDRIFIGKQSYTVTSNSFTKTGEAQGKKATRNVGIGAAVGGVLGGILGGTKGAVIGAGAGGGGGAVISKGEQIQIDSETQLLFKLENPLEVTIDVAPSPKPTNTSFGASGAPDGPARLAPPPERPSDRTSSTNSSANENDLTGRWRVTTDASQYGTMQLNLRQNGNNLQGSISDPRGSGTLPIRGSVSGNYINFSTQSQYGAYNSQMQFSGAVDGDRIQGTVIMPANGGYRTSTGYPGGGRPRTGGRNGGGSTQVHWDARRDD